MATTNRRCVYCGQPLRYLSYVRKWVLTENPYVMCINDGEHLPHTYVVEEPEVTEFRQPPEEPSYLMFARANARDNIPSSALIVRALLIHIDRLEGK